MGRASARLIGAVLATLCVPWPPGRAHSAGYPVSAYAGTLPLAAMKRNAEVAVLREKLVQVCALSPLTVEAALAILEVRRGQARDIGPATREWELSGNGLIARGRAGISGGTPYVEIVPARALEVSFEDVASAFLDAFYAMDSVEGHIGEDSVASVVVRNYHIFRVDAGELRIGIRTSVPEETPLQTLKARQDGWATGMGVNPRRELLREILISGDRMIGDHHVALGGGPPRSLRDLREMSRRKAAASQAQKPATAAPAVPQPR
jgi:hypothetical protein